MKQQKLVYVNAYCNDNDAYDQPVELPLQEYFDKGWRIVSYQFRDIEDNNPMVVVLLEKGE